MFSAAVRHFAAVLLVSALAIAIAASCRTVRVPTGEVRHVDRRSYACRIAQERISVDGDPRESTWRHSEIIERFQAFPVGSLSKPYGGVQLRVLYDETALYLALAVRCPVPPRDADVLEVFLYPHPKSQMQDRRYYEYHLYADGRRWDARYEGPLGGRDKKADDAWESGFQAASQSRPDGAGWLWTAEFAVPLEAMREQGKLPDTRAGAHLAFLVGALFASDEGDGVRRVASADLQSGWFHRIHDYDTLVFSPISKPGD